MLSLRSVVEGSFFFLGAKYLNQASRLQVTGQYPPLPSKGIPLQRNKMPQIDSIPKSPSAYFSPLTHLPSDRSQREPCLLLRVVAGEAPPWSAGHTRRKLEPALSRLAPLFFTGSRLVCRLVV